MTLNPVSRKTSICIGTSGWNYKHWQGPFYPDDLASDDWFDFYAEHLKSVEINNSFYQLPHHNTVRKWARQAPRGFRFAVKASRYITHMKKLKDPGEPVDRFWRRIQPLESHLGPVLFQLPPQWGVNLDRLAAFLESLPRGMKSVFEFRDQSWWTDDTYRLLDDHGAAFCIFDMAGTLSPKEVTGNMVYIRLHGPGDKYQGKYEKKALGQWAGAITAWQDQGKDVYCYFDNDDSGYAAQNALALNDMLS